MLCALILYVSGGIYSLYTTPNDRFFEKLFMAFLFTLRVFARNLLRGNRRRNTFRISFWCLAWDSNPGFSSNKPTHYLLDHGDFIVCNHHVCMYVCPNSRFLRYLIMAGLFTLRVFARNLLRKEAAEEIFFIFHIWWLTWDMNPGFCIQ